MGRDNRTARIAGLIYLIVVLSGLFSLAYVPSKLFIKGNGPETVQNIINSELLFRAGIGVSVICYSAFLLLPLVLYKLLCSVSESLAKLMVVLVLVSIPISFINLQNRFAVLSLVSGSDYLKPLETRQLQSQIFFYLDLYNKGLLIVQVFWGCWLLPFGYLVYKSTFLPRILGILLMLGCFGYLSDFFCETILSDYHEMTIARYMTLPASLGEIGICLWLLVMGTKH